jgi:hypothetical protein
LVAIEAGFLLYKVGVHPQKPRQGIHGVDDAESIGELAVEAAHGVDDKIRVGDGVADVGECVRQPLELTAVVMDRQITLLQTMEVLQGVDGTLGGVVEEETAHGGPSGEGSGAAVENHVADRLGDSEVDPRDDAMVDLRPFSVEEARLGVDGTVDMIQESEFAEG